MKLQSRADARRIDSTLLNPRRLKNGLQCFFLCTSQNAPLVATRMATKTEVAAALHFLLKPTANDQLRIPEHVNNRSGVM